MDTCPKCGFAELSSDKCPQCGVIVPLYKLALEKFRQGATASVGSSASNPSMARPTEPARPLEPRPAVSPGPSASMSRQLSFHGRGGTLLGIHIVNVCLTLLTLGIYWFWAKVRVRRYLLAHSEITHDRFAYHGTGDELLRGFFKAVVLFILPFTLVHAGARLSGDVALVAGAQALTSLALLVVVPIAMVGARRYRLSRTSWRAIRFGFDGGARDFVQVFVKGSLLTGLTLGLYYPLFHVRTHAFMVSHSRFGQRRFGFDGTPRETFRPFLLAVLLFLPTLGLSWLWHIAWRRRYYWSHTSFERARFRCTITGGQLLKLHLVNLLLLIVTAGIAWPWVRVRTARLALSTISLDGPLDLASILQTATATSATGDAASAILGAGFEMGA